jgi:hypothetical protein
VSLTRTSESRDEKRYKALRNLGCVACNQESRSIGTLLPVEVHHLVDKGYRKHSGGNQATIPLCNWHHRGEPIINHSTTWMRGMFGPSMYWEAKEFARLYGSQRDLLARVNELLSKT